MTTTDETALTLRVDPDLNARLRRAAFRRGLAVESYCQQAIESVLVRDEEQTGDASERSLSVTDLIRLRKEQFGDRVFPGDSADLIREARQIRDAQMDDW